MLKLVCGTLIAPLTCVTEYYTSHPPFNTASNVSVAAVGTVTLALQYGEVSVLYSGITTIIALTVSPQAIVLAFVLRRYPDLLRPSMWFGLALYFVSLFASSFATQASTCSMCGSARSGADAVADLATHSLARSWCWNCRCNPVHACHQASPRVVL